MMAVWGWQDNAISLDDCVSDMFEAGMWSRKTVIKHHTLTCHCYFFFSPLSPAISCFEEYSMLPVGYYNT